MNITGLLQLFAFLVILTILVKPLGGYFKRVFEGERTFFDPVLVPLERLLYRFTKVDPKQEMNALSYSVAFLLFSLAGSLILYVILRLQSHFPWYDKTDLSSPITPDLAFNTALSFVTTTTWQA